MRSEISFKSAGEVCAGWLYLPEEAGGDESFPVIVMAHGFSGVKEQGLAEYAERFADAGFAVVVFDFRFFGASGGQPRGQLFPLEMVEDYRNAISFTCRQPNIDVTRVGVWGTSYSGGLATYTATVDRRVKAVVAQAPSIMNAEERRAIDPERWDRVGRMLIEDREIRFDTGTVSYIPVVAPDETPCALPGKESYDFFNDASESAPNWCNEITIASLEKIREFDPVSLIHMLSPTALLIIAAEADSLIPAQALTHAFDRAVDPKRMVSYPIGHYEIYRDPWLSKAADDAMAWFREHLT